IGHKQAIRLFMQCYHSGGSKAHHKAIPNFIMNADNNTIINFIKWYWLYGDGHFTFDNCHNYYIGVCDSTSKVLILQLKELLLRLGILATCHTRKGNDTATIEGRTVRARRSY